MIELKVHEFNDTGREKAHALAEMLQDFESKVGTMVPRFCDNVRGGPPNANGARALALVRTKLEEAFHRALEAISTDPANMVQHRPVGPDDSEEEPL